MLYRVGPVHPHLSLITDLLVLSHENVKLHDWKSELPNGRLVFPLTFSQRVPLLTYELTRPRHCHCCSGQLVSTRARPFHEFMCTYVRSAPTEKESVVPRGKKWHVLLYQYLISEETGLELARANWKNGVGMPTRVHRKISYSESMAGAHQS